MDEELRDRIALFRYGVISPLVSRTLAPGEKERILAQIGEQEWEIPGTRRRRIGRSTARAWVAQYERHGFEGLKPIARKDTGRCRGLPDAIQDLLLRLREEHPGAPVTRLMDLVREAGPPGTPRLSRTTVYRFFARQAPGPGAAGAEPRPDARAFSHEHIND
ncbi:MAG: helix-turn-helix domain-containing protein, partial [Holophagales bacterium]|nr:helix-turn-helix domain-containing protein [Holophagales bacterium]